VYVWQCFYFCEPRWSPIRELVAAGGTYSQSHSARLVVKRASQSHCTHFYFNINCIFWYIIFMELYLIYIYDLYGLQFHIKIIDLITVVVLIMLLLYFCLLSISQTRYCISSLSFSRCFNFIAIFLTPTYC